MTLNVRSHIALAMTLVVTANVASGVMAWTFHQAASEHAASARHATTRSEWVAGVSGSVTEFVSEANDLAFGLSGDLSSEGSAEYGDVMGVDMTLGREVTRSSEHIDPSDAARLAESWDALRTDVFVWVNAEAAAAGSPTRLTYMDDGKVRASVTSNIGVPAHLAGLTGGEIRRNVRSEAEALRDGLLRDVARGAQADTAVALAREQTARLRALQVTVASILVSLLTAFVVAVWLYRTIAGPLVAARAVAERVSDGDLDARFAAVRDDEIGALVHAVEGMRDAVVSRIRVMHEMAGALLVTADGLKASAEDARASGNAHGDPALDASLEDLTSRTAVLLDPAGELLET